MVIIAMLNYSFIVAGIFAVIMVIFLAEYFKDSASTMFNLYTAFKTMEPEVAPAETVPAPVVVAKIARVRDLEVIEESYSLTRER